MSRNGSTGIISREGSIISGNVANQNLGFGMVVVSSTVLGNHASRDGLSGVSFGFSGFGKCGYAKNVMDGNAGGGPQVVGASNALQTGGNVCNDMLCP